MKVVHKSLGAALLGTLLTGAAFAQAANTTTTGSTSTQTNSADTAKAERGERHGKMMKELGLTDDQKAQLKSIHQDMKTQAKAIKDDQTLTADQKKEKIKALHEQGMSKRDAILTADQRQKMDQWKKEHKGKGHRMGLHRRHRQGQTQNPS